MVNKILGYALFGAGLVSGLLSYSSIRTLFGIPLPTTYDSYLLIAAVILLILGAFLAFRGSSGNKKGEEVPIYEGEGKNRKIVGYRKLK